MLYVALLRGVNVGGRTTVPMARLRELLAELGLVDVRTLLNSGNAVFGVDATENVTEDVTRPDRLAGRIESAIAERFDLPVSCLVRSGTEVRAVLAANPFPAAAADGARFLAVFTSRSLPAGGPDPSSLAPDDIRVGDAVIYQWCRDGVRAAPDVRRFVERNFGVTATARNWNTLVKIAALLAEPV